MSETDSSTSDRVFERIGYCEKDERNDHREFLLRHVDTLIEVLAGEQRQRQWMTPVGCPRSTSETLARRRSKNDLTYPCCYKSIKAPGEPHETLNSCVCGDPLYDSEEPLDSVAAAIVTERTSIVEHYYDRSGRKLVAELRDRFESWNAIAEASLEELEQASRECPGKRILDAKTAEKLQDALIIVREHRYNKTESFTLTDLPSVAYNNLHGMLVSLPGIGNSAAWWLLLTAFDKPVWPADEKVDALLVELGLLDPGAVPENGRHPELETELTDRQIPAFHRALAGHVRYCDGAHDSRDCELRQFCLTYRLHRQAAVTTRKRPTVVDLFCGAGGLSLGFTRGVGAPMYDVTLAVDNEQDATDTYRLNHPEVPHSRVLCEDISDLASTPEHLEELVSDVDVVVGGPPCQALSVAGYRARRANDETYSVLDDPRTGLYRHYVSLLETLAPRYVIMENVEGIRSPIGDNGPRVIDDVEDSLADAGYVTENRLLDCSEFGIPQRRDRVVLFGVRKDAVPDPELQVEGFFRDLAPGDGPKITIRQALSNLPRLRRGEGGTVVAGRAPGRASDYIRNNQLAGETRLTYNHQAREHPMEKDRKLFSEVMKPGDTGWDVKYRTDYGHLIEYDVGSEQSPAFKDKYRMLRWNRPAPTVVAHLAKDGNSFILPDYYEHVRHDEERQDSSRSRGITPREAARIQSFPDSYLFLGPFTSQFRQIGNAVPPLLGERIASVVGEYLAKGHSTLANRSTIAAANSDD